MTDNPNSESPRQSGLLNILKFLRFGVWKNQHSAKVQVTVDRRLLIAVWALAIYGAIQVVRNFDGMDATVIPDTFDYSLWPNAGGRVRVRFYEWWGLKRAEYIAESQIYVDDDDPDKTKQRRWMIINGSGPKLDDSGHERFPRLLFVAGYISADNFQTYVPIDKRDMRWFNFRSVEVKSRPGK